MTYLGENACPSPDVTLESFLGCVVFQELRTEVTGRPRRVSRCSKSGRDVIHSLCQAEIAPHGAFIFTNENVRLYASKRQQRPENGSTKFSYSLDVAMANWRRS